MSGEKTAELTDPTTILNPTFAQELALWRHCLPGGKVSGRCRGPQPLPPYNWRWEVPEVVAGSDGCRIDRLGVAGDLRAGGIQLTITSSTTGTYLLS
ncbi:MAG: hypothetical protein C0404_05595 [Verrucomicrobia bacterium]|nr:hypothetical protein [Verrucomicrobiota bacterium]